MKFSLSSNSVTMSKLYLNKFKDFRLSYLIVTLDIISGMVYTTELEKNKDHLLYR